MVGRAGGEGRQVGMEVVVREGAAGKEACMCVCMGPGIQDVGYKDPGSRPGHALGAT